ncbi:MAG: Npt1/Npt2 family nucleotide transporter [Deltaproteobacteria bacterium]
MTPTSSLPELPASDAERPSALDRALRVVADVRPGEGLTALGLATALFLLLLAYYIIKPVREALILQHPAGAEYKSWMGAGIAVLLLFVVPAYSKLADRLPRNRLVSGVTLFFASHLLLFYWASATPGFQGSLWFGLGFFLWVGIFNMLLVSQLWAFANDVYEEEQGRRLFAIVGVGASIGASAGGAIEHALASVLDLFQLLLVSALALAGVALIVQLVHRRELSASSNRQTAARRAQALDPRPAGGAVSPRDVQAPLQPGGAFAMLRQHRYLSLIAAFALVFTLVNTNGEYLLGKLIKADANQAIAAGTLAPDQIASFIAGKYNTFFLWVNALGSLLQLFVVSRLIKRVGTGPAFFILPVIALGNALSVSFLPVLGVLFVGKVLENSTDYSLNNTLRQMLWLPTTREMKYKAKQAVDTFFVRMGDVASGGWVALAISVFGLSLRGFALGNAALVGLWLWLAVAIVRAQRSFSLGGASALDVLSDGPAKETAQA